MRRGLAVLVALVHVAPAFLVAPALLVPAAIVGSASAQDDWGVTRDRRPPRDRTGRERATPRERTGPRERPARTPPGRSESPPADRSELLLQRYLRVLEADPADGFALDRLLELQRARDGTIDALVAALTQRVASEPSPYAPRMILGHVERRLGHHGEARAHYEAAVALREAEPLPHVALARVLREQSDLAGATAQLEQALALARSGPLQEEVLRELATIALEQGDVEGARRSPEVVRAIRSYSAMARSCWPRASSARASSERR